MKKAQEVKKVKVKLSNGVVLEGGKRGKKGETVTVPQNLGRIIEAASRGEILEDEKK